MTIGVSFRGGGESAGSVAYNRNVADPQPKASEVSGVNFKGYDYDYYDSPKKKVSPVGVIAGLLVGTAAVIGGLGYAHKANVLSKLKDGKIKDLLKKLTPATEQCYEWCTTVKSKCVQTWDNIKGFFSNK